MNQWHLAVPRPADRRGLLNPEEHMLPVRGVRAHFARPPAALNGFGPLRALQDLRIVNLVDRRVNRAAAGQLADTASDSEARGLALHAGDATDSGHLQQIRHVLGVVNFVEQRLCLGRHIHRGDKHIAG